MAGNSQKPLSYADFHSPTGLEGETLNIFTLPPVFGCVGCELEAQARPIAWVLWVGGIAFAIGGVGEAAAVIVGDWGVAWGTEALEVARVHLQGWVIVALDDVAALPFIF